MYSLDAKGDEGNPHHQNVQEVEVIPTECSFMEEGSVCHHLRRRQKKLEEQMTTKKKNIYIIQCTQDTHTHTQIESYTPHVRGNTPTHIQYKHVKQKKHMLTYSTLHLAHAHTHTSPHSFGSLWFGVASSEQWKRRLNLPSPPLQPLNTWM